MNGLAEITLNVQNIGEILRSPGSLVRKRPLKPDAEEFIIEEAEVLPRKLPIRLTVHLELSEIDDKPDLAAAVQRHFCYRREQAQKKIQRTMRYGWKILFIALVMLAIIYSFTELALHMMPENRIVLFARESFIILGWVGLWRPLDLLLYDWYPIKADINLYHRLEHCAVEVMVKESYNN